MKILIRGAGGHRHRHRPAPVPGRDEVVMTDLPAPTAIRRTVCFSQAIILGR